jgi:hypothetical protein
MNKIYWLIIPLVFIIIIGCFYWFQLRPSEGRKECSQDWIKYSSDPGGQSAEHNGLELKYGVFGDGDSYIKNCLASKGIK